MFERARRSEVFAEREDMEEGVVLIATRSPDSHDHAGRAGPWGTPELLSQFFPTILATSLVRCTSLVLLLSSLTDHTLKNPLLRHNSDRGHSRKYIARNGVGLSWTVTWLIRYQVSCRIRVLRPSIPPSHDLFSIILHNQKVELLWPRPPTKTTDVDRPQL